MRTKTTITMNLVRMLMNCGYCPWLIHFRLDPISSPTPLPRQSQNTSRRALTSNHVGRQDLNYHSLQSHARLDFNAGYDADSYSDSQQRKIRSNNSNIPTEGGTTVFYDPINAPLDKFQRIHSHSSSIPWRSIISVRRYHSTDESSTTDETYSSI